MTNYKAKLASWLTSLAEWLIGQPGQASQGSKFVDLAPTDKADPAGVYGNALTEAINNPRVMNIALTGPYGSGKSSIIKSFLKKYRHPVLQISLAAFLPEAVSTGAEVSRQEIERSILQQLLYGADANRLPLSRFKRIQAPGRWSFLASLLIVLGVMACWHLFQKRAEIVTGAYFTPFTLANWFNLLAFGVGGLLLWRFAHKIYIASFGISLKSVSLKDIEITPQAATEESILNRHLDEIIYFFQSTKYDLVVIEDLDRFNNSDIFVTLREINSIVNANSGVRRSIRFLYALRDDMFVNTDRTKFFEFIIPVIPIINRSNSIDKVLEQGKRLAIDSRLNTQFLREVSRYLNDLRLIQNIFNEYSIYVDNLETEGETNLDANKLLAILIYKNVFPSDFEKLHRGTGNLAEVLSGHDRYIENSEAQRTAEISRLERLVDLGEKQFPNDLNELCRIYAMALVELSPQGALNVSADRSSWISISALPSSDQLDDIVESEQVYFQTVQGYQPSLSLSGFQSKVDPKSTFKQRKKEIENKSTAFKESALSRIRELRAELANTRMMKFNEIIRENPEELDGLFSGFEEGAELARFLVLEGYLDDTYYQYTSLFHSGRLSPSDNKFLIRIRGFSNPDPDFQIDNPKEVIAAMRDEDFSRNYVLNVKIVDCLLTNPASYAAQTKQLLTFIASNFTDCEAFFTAYYARGIAVPILLTELSRTWPQFIATAIGSAASLTHVAQLVSHVPDNDLTKLTDEHPLLSEFVSDRLPEILALGISFPPERLQLLDIETTDLAALAEHPGFIRVLFDKGLYKISIENLNFIFRTVLEIEDETRQREQNYTLLIEAASGPLMVKVDDRFDEYLDNVLLLLPDNRLESIDAIHRLIKRDDLAAESVISFLEKQAASLPSLEQVPQGLHRVIFEIERIEPTWENCLFFLDSESYDADVLTAYLNSDATLAALMHHAIPDGKSAYPLRKFIIDNDALNNDAYAAYVKMLPRRFKAFPEHLSAEKTEILVDHNRVDFSATNLSKLDDDPALGVKFVENNIEEFFEQENECNLDDDFRENLLEAQIDDESRLKILKSMDLAVLSGTPSRAATVGKILARTEAEIDNLTADAVRAIILNSRPIEVQISLFNILNEKLDDQQVRDVLQSLPDPFPDIKPGWVTPRIEASEVNVKFVTWLKDRGFISSWKQGGFFDDDLRINLFRK